MQGLGREMLRLGLMAFLTLALGPIGTLQAGLLPTLNAVQAEANGFRWTYQIDGAAKVAVHPGDFFTIYDFDGMLPGTNEQPAFWEFSSSLLGADASQTQPNDNPTIPNLTWTYMGVHIEDTLSGLGVFSARSQYDAIGAADFGSQTHRSDTADVQNSVTPGDVAVPVGAVPGESPPDDDEIPPAPEPMTWVLLTLSLPALGAWKWLRRRA